MNRIGAGFRRSWKPLLGCSTTSMALFGLWSERKKSSSKDQMPRWTLRTGSFCLSKDDPISQLPDSEFLQRIKKLTGHCCGEDSFTISENSEQIVLAIADGVGGWRKRGVDPAKFSRCFMDQVQRIVTDTGRKVDDILLRSDEILKKAFYGLIQVYLRKEGEPFGSSTACIVSLQKREGLLDVANLGDSGVMLLRQGQVVFKSAVQQTRFNAPFQTTLRPNGNVDDMTPMADRTVIPVEDGDVILLATDGLWDNLWEPDLIEFCSKESLLDRSSLQRLAKDLVMKAREAAGSNRESPFAVESKKSGRPYTGGKPDDITVVMAVIKDTTLL